MSSKHQTTVRKLAAFIYFFLKYCNYFLSSFLIAAHVCIEKKIVALIVHYVRLYVQPVNFIV